ncbi:MAG: hypothetical protein E2P03_00080 [Acidobacteria bacterium]|nr:MAG: hypothetical protein E2P03_00080 [Acidobacteriota bacterium]
MMRRVLRQSFWVLAVVSLAGATSLATTMLHMNLDDMGRQADKIFRGTVLKVTEGEVEVGGGMLPTTTYVLQVDEAFKGEFETVKGLQLVEIRMLGKMRPHAVGSLKRMSVLPDMPRLDLGQTYLLFSTQPSGAGLSTTVGLGQGSFHLSGTQYKEMAVNEYGNLGLFKGMSVKDINASGPVPYLRLADQIRTGLAAVQGGN